MLYSFIHGAMVMTLATIPALILNAPVGVAASYWSSKEAKKVYKWLYCIMNRNVYICI